jgi:hypothetical protein
MESPAANTTTDGLMPMGSVSVASGGSMPRMARSVHCATMMLATPPMSARTMDSVRSWRMTCVRLAPSERRTAISVLRVAPRARSRLAMLAQAMSSTMPVMPKSSMSGVFASWCMELCPRCPSATVTSLARKRFSVCSLIPVWRGASTSLMIGL